MNEFVYSIIFSLLLLPMNFLCAHWLYKEALNLTGMTYREYIKQKATDEKAEREEVLTAAAPPRYTDPEEIELSEKTRHLNRNQRHFIFFLHKYSTDPERSIRLVWANGFCSFLGLAALLLAEYTAVSHYSNKLKIALILNILLFLLNVGLLLVGRLYRKKHPLDERLAETLQQKREQEKTKRRKHPVRYIVGYGTVGVILFGMLLFFMIGFANFAQIPPQENAAIQTAPPLTVSRETMHDVLQDNGFETVEIPVTYWYLEENNLVSVCAGVKDDVKFEYYDYHNGEAAENVYKQIAEKITPDMKAAERESCETLLSDSGKMFSGVFSDTFQVCLYREDTLIYACCPAASPRSLDEINLLLYEIGYLTAA